MTMTDAELDELVQTLTARAEKTTLGFSDLTTAADEIEAQFDGEDIRLLAETLYQQPPYQARMLALLLLPRVAAQDPALLTFLRETVSTDPDWQVQELLANAFDAMCKQRGYETSLSMIDDWLSDSRANVRRAVSEGLRRWTARPYFKQHPQEAIRRLSALRADESDYVRRSAGNALRDISRKHKALIAAEVATWDLNDKRVAQTYSHAARFLDKE